MNINAAFEWKCHPDAENYLLQYLHKLTQINPFIADLEASLLKETSTRLFDWIDHLNLAYSAEEEKRLKQVGFVEKETDHEGILFYHPGAQLPRVFLQKKSKLVGVAITVESIADFLLVHGGVTDIEIEGTPLSPYRKCLVNKMAEASLWIIERRGTFSVHAANEKNDYSEKYLSAQEKWEKRPRNLPNEDLAYQLALKIAQEIIDLVGRDTAAWIVLDVERKYWQSRNLAGQLQKSRQDKLGMGWANHDHHTFRSSRKYFTQLVKLFELLGFHCRERYYTGQEAGWGAQIMENPVCRLVLFLDVDLGPDEITQDFAHEPLTELPKHNTIGLWCALHGDSIMKAGMHHLESQFMFDELSHDLAEKGIAMMQPFSSFPYLRQAFTKGETWEVDPKRIDRLLKDGKITQEQANKFLSEGALGSHMENLQRREGYKGFNQKNVSIIIKKTDPRLMKDEV